MAWSAWQDPPPDSYSIGYPSVQLLGDGRMQNDSSLPLAADPAVQLPAWQAAIRAGGGASTTPNDRASWASLLVTASRYSDIDSAMGLALGQGQQNFLGSIFADRFDWFPPPLPSLVEGVDYAVRPDRSPGDEDAYVQYEAAHTTCLGWADLTVHLAVFSDVGEVATAGATAPGWFEIPVRFAWSPLIAGPTWNAYGTGTDLGELVIDPAWVTDPTSLGLDVAVPLAGLPVPADFSLLAQSALLGDQPIPIPGLPPGAAGNFPSYQAQMSLTVTNITGAQVIYQRPRWRYWALKTIPSYLRMTQRNDGLGIARHPRLRAAHNHPTSTQLSATPRLGGGTYH